MDMTNNTSPNATDTSVIPAPPAPRMKTLDMGETCSFLQVDARGCRAPRSCASCLETTGCMISQIGACVSPRDEQYDPGIEYRNAISNGLVVASADQAASASMRAPQKWQFPAGSVRYCNSSDATCRTCIRAIFYRASSSFPDSRFCLGDDDKCVCIDVCERQWYTHEDCSGDTPTTSDSRTLLTSGTVLDRLWQSVLSVGVFVLAVLMIMLHKQRMLVRREHERQAERDRQEAARRERRFARSRELGVEPLSFSGWEAYRREQFDKEIAQLASTDDDDDESKTGDVEDSLSQDDNVASDTSAVYVRLEENGPSSTGTIVTTSGFASYNEATPVPQALAPLVARPQRVNYP